MRKNRQTASDEEEEQQDDTIIDGANDLMMLPVEKIRQELKKRGFHPKYVDKCNQVLCVKMLREDISKNSKAKAFSTEKAEAEELKKDEEEEKLKQELEEKQKAEEQKEQEFDPNIFMKETFDNEDGSLPSAHIIVNKARVIPAWQSQQRYSDFLIENYVPASVLDSLPLNIQQQVKKEMDTLTNYAHPMHNQQAITKYMTIPEIIRRIIVPNIGKGVVQPATSTQESQDFETQESTSNSSSCSSSSSSSSQEQSSANSDNDSD